MTLKANRYSGEAYKRTQKDILKHSGGDKTFRNSDIEMFSMCTEFINLRKH